MLETVSGVVGVGLGVGSVLGVTRLRGDVGGRAALGGAQAARIRKTPNEKTAPTLNTLFACGSLGQQGRRDPN